MDLEELKSAWSTYSSKEESKHRLGKDLISEMLKNKSHSLVERIDRNIQIGMMVILLFIAYIVIDDLYLSKLLIEEPVQYPTWLVPIDVFSNVLIVTTYLFFVLRYFRIKKSFSPDNQLKALLTGILETIKIYRRMFYLAVVILLINMIVGFSAGLYLGVKFKADSTLGGIQHLTTSKMITIIMIGLAILIPFIALTFYLLRWGFNRLYGRYQVGLTETLLELNESSDLD